MNRLNLLSKIKIFSLALFANLPLILTKAQDKAADLKVDVDINKGGDAENWMNNPLIWIIGALLLILIIALLVRGKK